MNNPFAVGCFQRLENLPGIPQRLQEGERTTQGFALDILHNQVIGPDIVHGGDVRMVQGRGGAGLAFDPIAELVLRGFQSDDAIKPRITGFEDLSHATGSDALNYLIRSYAGWRPHRRHSTSA